MIEFSVNHVYVGPKEPLWVDGRFALLGDHSRSGIDKADARLIGTHARLCSSIRFLEIAKSIAPQILGEPSSPSLAHYPHPSPRGWPLWRSVSAFLSVVLPCAALGNIVLTLWLVVPKRARIATYELLIKLGRALYGPNTAFVQRLPFGLYLKFHAGPGSSWNEFNALGLVDQMRDYLTQIRSIPNLINPDAPICNAAGEACRDSRIRGEKPVGPFPNEASFSQMLRFPDEASRRGHQIVFTHADLNPRNILVDEVTYEDGTKGWGVTGIVDWEFAGYYPILGLY